MSAVVVKAGGEVRLTDRELTDTCGYHLERIDHVMGGVTLRVPEATGLSSSVTPELTKLRMLAERVRELRDGVQGVYVGHLFNIYNAWASEFTRPAREAK